MTETLDAAPDLAPARPPLALPPLRRNLQFQTIWVGSAASTLGVAVADVAYPLAILAVTGSPGRAGLFAAVQALGVRLAGLPAGQLADRTVAELLADPRTLSTDDILARTEYALAGRFATIRTVAELTGSAESTADAVPAAAR